jgi:hypothetical protein
MALLKIAVLVLTIMQLHVADGAKMKALGTRFLAASAVPDPTCKTGIISLKTKGQPQSCCPGYCGQCNDYKTCKSVNGQASENACCASKVYEMRCGNAPANVCLKTCSEAVPPCIMDKDADTMTVKLGAKTYKGVPPCNEVVPYVRNHMATAVAKGELLAKLHTAASGLQHAIDDAKSAKKGLEKDSKKTDVPKEALKKFDVAIKHDNKVLKEAPKALADVQKLQEKVSSLKIGKEVPHKLDVKLDGAMAQAEKEQRDAKEAKEEGKALQADVKADVTKKEDQEGSEFGSEYTIAAVSKTARGPYLSHNGDHGVDLWKEAGVNQKWTIEDQGGNEYTIAATAETKRGPYVSHDTTKSVDLWKEAGVNQKWNLVNHGNDEYTIAAIAKTSRGPYLSHDEGHSVDLWTEAGYNQKWSIPGLLPSEIVITTIEAVSATNRGPYVSHNGRETVDLWKEAGVNQKWKLVNQGGHEYTITAASETTRGPYLSHDGNKAVDLWTQAGPSQKWSIVNQGGDEYTIAAVSKISRGPYLRHDGDKTVDLWKEAGVNQRWRIPGLQK